MFSPRFVKENIEAIKKKLKERKRKLDLDEFIQLDAERKKVLQQVEELRSYRNRISDRVGEIVMKSEDAPNLREKVRDASAKIKGLEEDLKRLDERINEILLDLPNIHHHTVPAGPPDIKNDLVKEWGSRPEFDFPVRSHWELGEALDFFDFESAAEMSGAHFVVFQGNGARLKRSLMNFMMDVHTGMHGYKEADTPLLVKSEAIKNAGWLPFLSDELFACRDSRHILVPGAEVGLLNLNAGRILDDRDLPLKYAAYAPCFRRQFRSYGKENRGLIRTRQFDQIDLLKLVSPETSYDELDVMVNEVEHILELLRVPYRVLELCAPELKLTAAKAFCIEAWIPSLDKYKEIAVCCNTEDFLSRRAEVKFKNQPFDKPEYVHVLTSPALPLGRTMAALMENGQTKEGKIRIPESLKPYLGGAVEFP